MPAQVLFTFQANGTLANEVTICHSILQWPFLTEMSLISSIVSIFVTSWGKGPLPLFDTLLLTPRPWFYFNLVVQDSQVRTVLHGPGASGFAAPHLCLCSDSYI